MHVCVFVVDVVDGVEWIVLHYSRIRRRRRLRLSERARWASTNAVLCKTTKSVDDDEASPLWVLRAVHLCIRVFAKPRDRKTR